MPNPTASLPPSEPEETPLNMVQNATDSGPINDYGIRGCRGHWHVTVCGEDLIGTYSTPDEAQRVADQNNAGDHFEPRGRTNEELLAFARSLTASSTSLPGKEETPPNSGDLQGFRKALDAWEVAMIETGEIVDGGIIHEWGRINASRSSLEGLYASLQRDNANLENVLAERTERIASLKELRNGLLDALIDCGTYAGGYEVSGPVTVEIPKAVERLAAEISSLRSELEKAVANALTPEEAKAVLDDWDWYPVHTDAKHNAVNKLRAISSTVSPENPK